MENTIKWETSFDLEQFTETLATLETLLKDHPMKLCFYN